MDSNIIPFNPLEIHHSTLGDIPVASLSIPPSHTVADFSMDPEQSRYIMNPTDPLTIEEFVNTLQQIDSDSESTTSYEEPRLVRPSFFTQSSRLHFMGDLTLADPECTYLQSTHPSHDHTPFIFYSILCLLIPARPSTDLRRITVVGRICPYQLRSHWSHVDFRRWGTSGVPFFFHFQVHKIDVDIGGRIPGIFQGRELVFYLKGREDRARVITVGRPLARSTSEVVLIAARHIFFDVGFVVQYGLLTIPKTLYMPQWGGETAKPPLLSDFASGDIGRWKSVEGIHPIRVTFPFFYQRPLLYIADVTDPSADYYPPPLATQPFPDCPPPYPPSPLLSSE